LTTAPATRPGWLERLLPRRNLAATVYGTVLVSSVIVGLDDADYSAGSVMAAVGVTALVFALAHAWAETLAHSAWSRRHVDFRALKDGLEQEWPMAEAVGPALLAMFLAVLGVYSTDTGLWVAIIANTFLLFFWGAAIRQRAGGAPVQLVVAGLETSTLGLVLVALKALVH
jgi:hypothetical protein